MVKYIYSDRFGQVIARNMIDADGNYCIQFTFPLAPHINKQFITCMPYFSIQERDAAFENLTSAYVESVFL